MRIDGRTTGIAARCMVGTNKTDRHTAIWKRIAAIVLGFVQLQQPRRQIELIVTGHIFGHHTIQIRHKIVVLFRSLIARHLSIGHPHG